MENYPSLEKHDQLNISNNLTTSIHKYLTNSNEEDQLENFYYPDFSQIGVVRAVFVFLFLVEFVISVTGNLLVCITVYKNKSMHSPVNYGIVNLGICDFLIGGFVLPTKLFELTAPVTINVLNDFGCTIIRFLESTIIFVSVYTIVAICIERYFAVVFPMQSRIHLTGRRIRMILMSVWIIPILVATPNLHPAIATRHLLYSEFGQFTRLTCFDTFPDQVRMWYFLFLFVFIYLVPLTVIGITCFSITRTLMKQVPIETRLDVRAVSIEHGRRKVGKMILVIVFTFIICWSPYFIVTAITQLQNENFLHNGQYFFTMLSINLSCFTNSCVNPFVYFSMSSKFRKGFICVFRLFNICSPRRRRSSFNSSHTSSRRNRLGSNLNHQNINCPITSSHSSNSYSIPSTANRSVPRYSPQGSVIQTSASSIINRTRSYDSNEALCHIPSTHGIKKLKNRNFHTHSAIFHRTQSNSNEIVIEFQRIPPTPV